MSEAILVERVSKRFAGTGGVPVTAVDALSFAVAQGSATALLGGNGAGKTTTIAMILGLMTVDEGRIAVLGHDMAVDRFRALARMNFSSPYVELPFRLTVRENLRVYAGLYGLRRPEERIRELAEDLALTPVLDRKAGSLSAGQKTRVTLAKALINRPEVLLLDEPTASLDPDTADQVRTLLERYRAESGASLLLASHNMAEVERLCDHVLMMKGGRLVDRGSPAELIARHGREDLEQVFLAIARNQTQALEESR